MKINSGLWPENLFLGLFIIKKCWLTGGSWAGGRQKIALMKQKQTKHTAGQEFYSPEVIPKLINRHGQAERTQGINTTQIISMKRVSERDTWL